MYTLLVYSQTRQLRNIYLYISRLFNYIYLIIIIIRTSAET